MRGDFDWKLLTADDERRLHAAMQTGCVASRNELIQSSILWVKKLSKSIRMPPLAQRQDREDLESEMLLSLMKYIDRFDPERGRLTTFVKQVVMSKAFYWVKRTYRKNQIRTQRIVSDPGERIEQADFLEHARLAEHIRRLPKKYREIVELRHRDGLTLDEIGARCGFSDKRAYQILRKCYRRLAELLEPERVQNGTGNEAQE